MKLSKNGIELIKSFEGCRLHAYKALPTEEYYTIGYGHYSRDVKENQVITQNEANVLLLQDLQKFEDTVNNSVKVTLNQNQFDALVSFTYNVGVHAFQTSTLLEYLNDGKFVDASNEFDKWVHSHGKVIQGLVNRRKVEKSLFNKAIAIKHEVPHFDKYKVRGGDTLSKIASIYNTSVQHLLNINPQIKHANLIYVNDEIYVPKINREQLQTYVIKNGDTLTKIAIQHHTTVQHLLELNKQIEKANEIYAGDSIHVPK